jgi:hypothetical protein
MSDKVIFVDNIGRTIVGLENSKASTKTQLAVDDPAIVFVQPNPENGQIQVQVIPLFFKELMSEDTRQGHVTWLFNKNALVTSDNLVVDEKLTTQYERVVNASAEPVPGIVTADGAQPAGQEPEVVKLFDDEEK